MPQEDPIKFWQHVHGASVHFPIALILVAVAFDLGAIVFKRDSWRTVGFWCLFAGALIAIPAVLSGLTGQLGWFGVEKWNPESERMPLHRLLALIGGGVAIIASGIRVGTRDKYRGPAHIVVVLIQIAAAAILGWTGFLGAYVARGY